MTEKDVRAWIQICKAEGIEVPEYIRVLDAYAYLLEARILNLLNEKQKTDREGKP